MIIRLFLLTSTLLSFFIKADDENIYIVKSGDTLWSISNSLEIPIKELIEFNKFSFNESGYPIIVEGQNIKISLSSSDDVSRFCYSHTSWKGPNFSKVLSKRDLITTCTFKLHKALDNYVVGNLDSWHMTIEEADQANEKMGIQLSWNNSKEVNLDTKFWDIYFSDIRYSYYFYNLSFSESHKDDAYLVLYEAALRGDYLAANFILDYRGYFFKEFGSNFKDYQEMSREIILSLPKDQQKFFKSKYFWIFGPENVYPGLGLINKEGIATPLFINLENLDDHQNAEILFHKTQSSYRRGDSEYYILRQDALRFLNKSSSKLLSWYEVALVINLMYQSLNLSDPELASEISKNFEKRLEIASSKKRYHEIYNRFVDVLYFEDEYDNFDLIFTWILNLSSVLYDLENYDLESFLDNRTYLMEFVDQAKEQQHIPESSYAEWLSDTAAHMLSRGSSCVDVESYYEKAFEIYESEKENSISIDKEFDLSPSYKTTTTDAHTEPLELARCFLKEKKFNKVKFYIDLAANNLEYFLFDKTFYESWIAINQTRYYLKNSEFNRAAQYLKLAHKVFKEESSLSYTLNIKDIEGFIQDYLLTINEYAALNLNIDQFKDIFELEAFKNRLLINRRLESLKIDKSESNLADIKKQLSINKNNINDLEEKINKKIEPSYIENLDSLYKSRKTLISKLFDTNKQLENLFNPSFEEYSSLKKKLDDNEVILTINIGDSGGTLIATSNDRTILYPINTPDHEIRYHVRSIRKSLNEFSDDFAFESSFELYKILVKPMEEFLKDKDTIYLYGSALEDLPLGILITNYDEINKINSTYQKFISSNWLIKDFSFARIFPLTNQKVNKKFDYKFLGIGNPSKLSSINLPPLPNAESEIRDIAVVSSSFSREFILLGHEASKSNLFDKLNNSYERLVFATHAVPSNWRGVTSESSLILDDESGDYFLSSTDLINLDIRSDVVVLSSCSTEKAGSESLYKAFLIAGSNSVVYSNWELETTSASEITSELFKLMLFDGVSKHKALQSASIKLLNDYSNKSNAHPAMWGNFTIAYKNL